MKGSVLREKMLGDFHEQLGKSFEHEARLKELLVKQSALNAALDLDKGERQVAPEEGGEPQANDDDPPAPVRAPSWKEREMQSRTRAYRPPTLRPSL
jgi:hypothetical protein